MPDVFKILKDLEAKAVGIDPNGDKMQEGFFVAFRSVGLPIHKDDYDNPWDPFGGNLSKALEKAAAQTPPADPATAPKRGADQVSPKGAMGLGRGPGRSCAAKSTAGLTINAESAGSRPRTQI